ncbi:RNA/RNP complex-1-interacting phosphatase [Elysia marginata]|uniref:RNA/RNP complex-1-interacting phosphatase n=1 Tax=Elysia marginata TaxID=1093978 RepID=A0AAV4EJ50_9GAST|nr:RNA/RNP complex-1-interacting phosphatase [Elysia marginata]
MPPPDRFSPTILLRQLGEQNLTLAGVIDLTFTKKYYNKEEFLHKSVGHKKVFTKGHEVPSDGVYKEFTEAVESFSNDENLIGVHCTHGVNRTGYMIEKMNMNPQEAIDLFNDSRGHNIERENYIADLKRRKSGESLELLSQDKPIKKKPRWRHHKEDHPNWRQRGPHGPEEYAPSPSHASSRHEWQERHSNTFQPYFNPRFALPYSGPRRTLQNDRDFHFEHWRNSSPCFDQPHGHDGRAVNARQGRSWQDPFSYHHHNGYNNHLYHQGSERHIRSRYWEQTDPHSDEHYYTSRGQHLQQRSYRYN